MACGVAMGVLGRVRSRSDEIVDALSALDGDDLLEPSQLPGWNRLTLACHLRYGAVASLEMTTAALHGRPTAFYPDGRSAQRESTLVPHGDETPEAVVASLGSHAEHLTRVWAEVPEADWTLPVLEFDQPEQLGCGDIAGLALLRLTEVEVHGADLGLGLSPWAAGFGPAVLSQRVRRLPCLPVATASTWLLHATDGVSHVVTTSLDGTVTGRREASAAPTADIDVTVRATANHLVAVLLGRAPLASATITGNPSIIGALGSHVDGP